jgi:hypothetical protein
MKLVPLTALAAAVITLVAPATASASRFVQYGVQDDAFLQTGPVEGKVQTLDRLGVKLVRYTLNWREIALKKPAHPMNPNDRAYDWSRADETLKALHKQRIAVLVTLYGSPAWANGRHAANFIPTSKTALSSFAYAAAKRYPWITMWEVWNEPNLRRFLRPFSPALYVQRLLNPTYAALHAIRRSNRVAGGATSPRATGFGRTGISPIAFMRGMRAAHPHMDAYSHHPYPVTRSETPWGFAPGTCKYCKGVLTLANLPALLKEVQHDFGRKRIWLTEWGYQTNPPDRIVGVSYTTQAQYVSQAALRALEAPYVDIFIHFMVKDDVARLVHSRGAGGQGDEVPDVLAGGQELQPRRHGALSSTRSMTTSSRGLSRASVSTWEIASTTPIPSVTPPKTVCFPSSHGVSAAVTMKNWLPFVFGPAFAIASAPRTALCRLISSSNS